MPSFLLKLLLENRFPRIWVPSPENRDLRQLCFRHRHRLVQMRIADHESTAGGGVERGLSLEEKTVQANEDEHC